MKRLFWLLLFIAAAARAQVPQPHLVSLKTIGGNASDDIGGNVVTTQDGGFVVAIGTSSDPTTGNIDSYCPQKGKRNIFQKYNAAGTSIEWTRCYELNGDTLLYYLFPKNDGGVVIGGVCAGWGYYICRHDASGNILWSHEYSKGNSLMLSCMIETDDGGYIMAGGSHYVDTNVDKHYGSFTESDIFVMKVDSDGNKVWSKVIGGTQEDVVKAIVSIPSGGYYIVGYTYSNDYECVGNHGAPDIFVARLNEYGSLLWGRCVGGLVTDAAVAATPDNKGGVLLAGWASSSDGDVTKHNGVGPNIWVIDIDSSNNILWDNCYGGGGGDCFPNSICKATDGSIWIAATTYNKSGEIDTNYGKGDAWFLHADSAGNFLNAKVLGSHKEDRGRIVYPLSDGNVLAGGFYDTSDGTFNDKYYGVDDVFLAVFAPWNQTIVDEVAIGNGLVRIYPNPAKEQLIVVGNDIRAYSIAITDLLGKVVFAKKITERETLNVGSWVKGVYYIHATDDLGRRSVQKILVQ